MSSRNDIVTNCVTTSVWVWRKHYSRDQQTLPSEVFWSCVLASISKLPIGQNANVRTVLNSWSHADSKTVLTFEFWPSGSWDIGARTQDQNTSEGNVCWSRLYLSLWLLVNLKFSSHYGHCRVIFIDMSHQQCNISNLYKNYKIKLNKVDCVTL